MKAIFVLYKIMKDQKVEIKAGFAVFRTLKQRGRSRLK